MLVGIVFMANESNKHIRFSISIEFDWMFHWIDGMMYVIQFMHEHALASNILNKKQKTHIK